MEYEVTWTVTYTTVVRPEPGQKLDDAITNIDIPEGEGTKYVCDTFDVVEVTKVIGGGRARRLTQEEIRKTVG